MNTVLNLLLIICLIILAYYLLNNNFECFTKMNNYKGLVLFDIDGTLTTGLENKKVVQYFLDNNYAVGITTAGSVYTPENVKNFDWMPDNLYNFMKENNFNTFNNVMSGIVAGKYNPSVYKIPFNMDQHMGLGWKKAKSMEKTAQQFNITDPSKIILLDNDPLFLIGVLEYNKKYTVIPAGEPADKYQLSMETIDNYFKKNN